MSVIDPAGDAVLEHLDRETSRALLQEAETLATNGSVKPWTLANAWKAMGDDDAVARVLDGALAVATASHESSVRR